jgi:hypothetical protein
MRVVAIYFEDNRFKSGEWTNVGDLFDVCGLTLDESVELELILRLRDGKRPERIILQYAVKAPSGELISNGEGTIVVNLRAVLDVPENEEEDKGEDTEKEI